MTAPRVVVLSRFRRFVAFWLAGSDGRANYSRATALVGLVLTVLTVMAVLYKYVVSEKVATEPLMIAAGTALACLGINLGQLGVTLNRDTKSQAIAAGMSPQAPPAAAPAASSVTVNTGDQLPRDSGTGPVPNT